MLKVLLVSLCLSLAFGSAGAGTESLLSPERFSSIADRAERSRALFKEAARVLTSPRCLNCHPVGDTPTQGDDMHIHYPPVTRGPNDQGVVGMQCATCHQDHNLELAKVPGAPNWHLAHSFQAWAGKSVRLICEILRNPKTNGNRSLEQIVEHSAHDPLVGWGWAPGMGRTPAPGTQEQFGKLISAWVATGAECDLEKKSQ